MTTDSIDIQYNSVVENEDLKILLALEPVWTVCLNGLEFQTIPSSDISLDPEGIRLGKWVRQIHAVEWLRPNVVRIRARQKFRSQPDIFTLYPGERLPSLADLRRRRRSFQSEIRRALCDFFNSKTVQRETLYSDRRYGIGGAYPRLIVGGHPVIAVDPDESTPTVNSVMRAALLWSMLIRKRVTVVVPKGRAQTIAIRLQILIKFQKMFDWLEWDGERISALSEPADDKYTAVQAFSPLGVESEIARLQAGVSLPMQPVLNIAAQSVSLRFRGIDVAHIRDGSVTFPCGEPLEKVVAGLAAIRTHGSTHPLARAHEERWLESNLLGEIDCLLPSIDSRHVYPQVPSFVGEERNIVDLLTVTVDGRLVVMEIKASADPDLPFQALDYWIAVERHRKAGDFQRKGYFNGIELKDIPALLVLVAPLLAFHKTFKRIVSAFPQDLPLLQIGLNQTWKREIKILRRQRLLG
jgi:hypothetical protein